MSKNAREFFILEGIIEHLQDLIDNDIDAKNNITKIEILRERQTELADWLR